MNGYANSFAATVVICLISFTGAWKRDGMDRFALFHLTLVAHNGLIYLIS
jgi:hypothetical protein